MSGPAAFDAATLAFYEAEAPIYAASGTAGTSRHLPGFLARLAHGARVLDMGCSQPAARPARHHHEPDALAALYRASGAWSEIAVEPYDGGYDRVEVPWAAVTARRA